MEHKSTAEDIEIMRKWIEQVPYLPLFDDHVLAIYIQHAKGSLERAKTIYTNGVVKRTKYPELMVGLDPCSKQQRLFMEHFLLVPLPKRAPDGSIVIIASFQDSDPKFFCPIKLYRQFGIIIRHFLLENLAGECKLVLIQVCQGLTLDHITKYTPGLLLSLVDIIVNVLPMKLQGVHVTNLPGYAEWMWNMMKSLIKNKLAERFKVHSDGRDLIDVLPKEVLPLDFGGDEEALAVLQAKFLQKLEASQELFSEYEQKAVICDQLRPRVDEDIVVGTFRKLAVD